MNNREEKLTARDREVLAYITNSIREDGYGPTVRDIQTALGIKSSSTVFYSLARLEEQGFIRRDAGKSRSLRLEMNAESEPPQSRGVIKLPLLGKVAAGNPILAANELEGFLDFPLSSLSFLPSGSELFALRVRGDSMIGDGIFDGDIVVVRRDSRAADGDLIVALLGDEATVKRIYREPGRFRLQPSNPAMSPIYSDEVETLGHVVAVMRLYQH